MEIASYIKPFETQRIDGSINDVLDSFRANKERTFIPVVNSFGEPLGIIREQTLRDFTLAPFGRDLLKRCPISEFLSTCPVVSFDTQFETLIQTPTFQERREGFIIVKEGKYAGFLTVSTLLKMYEEHRLQTQLQLLQAQKMESIGTLAGGIAHDFNNILAAITGHVALIKLKTSFEETNPISKYLNNIEALSLRASDLTKQLLGFARGGKYQLKPQNLNDTLTRVLSLLRRTFNRSIVFEESLCENLGVIDGDQGQLEQVLMNLFINARDAMPDGGVLSVSTRNLSPTSEVVATQLNYNPSGGIALEIRDSGTGMPAEVQARIFEPFFTTKERGKGTGMGLAMVYGIVQNHGGTIQVQSKEGQGSVFTLYFPCSATKKGAGPAAQPATVSKPFLGKLRARVMVVDDDPYLLPVMSLYLEEMGCSVAAFRDGREAIRHYREGHIGIDLVLLDMIMPNISGKEVYHELKQINPALRVIFLSGYNNNGTMQELLTHDRTDFLPKPVSFDTLLKRMSEAQAAA